MSGGDIPVSCFSGTSRTTMAMPCGAVSSPGGRPRPAPPMIALRSSFEAGFGMVLSVIVRFEFGNTERVRFNLHSYPGEVVAFQAHRLSYRRQPDQHRHGSHQARSHVPGTWPSRASEAIARGLDGTKCSAPYPIQDR